MTKTKGFLPLLKLYHTIIHVSMRLSSVCPEGTRCLKLEASGAFRSIDRYFTNPFNCYML